MAEVLDWILSFWLPHELSYNDIRSDNDLMYVHPNDLAVLPLFGLAIYVLRSVYERFIAMPLSKALGLPDGTERKQAPPNERLEKYFKENSRQPSNEDNEALAKQLNWPVTSVRKWFRRRRNWNRPSIRTKFCETSWRLVFYTFLFSYGVHTLWQSPWLWDLRLCWVDYPRQPLQQATYNYYMLEASFYIALLFSVMGDIKRKDFAEQLIHHVSTIFLIVFSYLSNFVRIGTVVMALHDVSDVLLEAAKCFHYSKYTWIADQLFVVFAVVFFVSRLFVFPFWVIESCLREPLKHCVAFTGYYLFNGLLLMLLCLHIFWGSIILKMAYNMSVQGEVQKDDRSDTEELSSDEEREENGSKMKKAN